MRQLLREKYAGERTEAAEKDIARLQAGEHLDYVIGFVEFLGCRIDLSFHPLIPRPETEYWAEKAIEDIKGKNKPKVLDLFAGSGCVGLAVLKHTEAAVDFGEKDAKLLRQIRKNLRDNAVEESRYRLIQTDVFSTIWGTYDYILANPPYVAEGAWVQDSVLREPREALFAGKDGLNIITPFLKQARDRLARGGRVYMEFGEGQAENVAELCGEAGYSSCAIHRDREGRERYCIAA